MHALHFAETGWLQLIKLGVLEGFVPSLVVLLFVGLSGIPILEASRSFGFRRRSDRVTVEPRATWHGLFALGLAAIGVGLLAIVIAGAGGWLLERALPWLDEELLHPYFSLPAVTNFFVIVVGTIAFLRRQSAGARLAGLLGGLLAIGLIVAAFEWGLEPVYYGLTVGLFALITLGTWTLRTRPLVREEAPVRRRTPAPEPGIAELPRPRRRRRLGRLRSLPGHALRGDRGSERLTLRPYR